MTLYARQVNPEHQGEWLWSYGFPEDVAIYGNRDYKSHIPEDIEHVKRTLEGGELSDCACEKGSLEWFGYKNLTEACMDYLPPTYKERYNTKDIHELKMILQSNIPWSDENIAKALSIVTGKPWAYDTIGGNCQGEWQNVLYPVDDMSPERFYAIETAYFNTGSEWIIHEGDEEPKDPEDISGLAFYTAEWHPEAIKDEVREYCGAPGDEPVVLYEWAGYICTPDYRVVE